MVDSIWIGRSAFPSFQTEFELENPPEDLIFKSENLTI